MPIYTDRITLVFPIAAKNRVAAASLQTLEVTDSGKEFENLIPLDPALVADYASAFNLDALGQVTALESEKTQLTTDLATRTSERDALQSQVTALESERQELNSRIADLDTALDDEQRLSTQLQARVAELEQYRPFNPRVLKGEAFYNRVSKEDMVTLLTSEDPQLVLVGKTIDAYRDNAWPVILDSTDFQQLVGYVQLSGVFDQAEVDAVMVDATREEAYTA